MSVVKHILTVSVIATSLALPYRAWAAETPSYAAPSGEQTIHGTITAFHGKYGVNVRDEHGYVDSIALHQGTVINPTGLALQQGMPVTIVGHGDGDVFAANEIDVPVQYVTSPYPAYGPWWDADFGFRWRGFRGRFGW
jgi:hypothetical protein